MRTRSVMLLLAVSLAAPLAVAQDATAKPAGEVRFHASGGVASSASFGPDRIVGPMVNLSRSDRGWAGSIAGQDVMLAGDASRLSAPNVKLTFRQKDGKTEVEGLFYGTRIRLSVDGKKLKGRYGTCSFDLTRSGPPIYSGDVGCIRGDERRRDPWERPEPRVDELKPRPLQVDSNPTRSAPIAGTVAVELVGEAAGDNPPAAQLGLALVAILPR